MHAITCPPLTNKEGKKRGAGNDTSFQLQHGQLQFWMVRWPFASSNENENENENEDHAAASCWLSSRRMVSWTVGHCNGNENEANETRERGSVNTDTGL